MDPVLLLPARPKPFYQRDEFLNAYAAFCAARGAKYSDVLHIRRLPVDVYELWAMVRQQGGHNMVSSRKLWAATARSFHHPANWTNASHYFKATYESSGLGGLEDLVDAGRFSIPAAAFVDAPGEQQQQQQQQQQDEDKGGQLQQQEQEQDPAALPASLLDQLHSSGSLEAAPAAAAAQPAEAGSSGSSRGTVSQQQLLVPLLLPGEAARAVLDVRCGPAVGVFDMARQRVFCHCGHCESEAGPTGVEMVPTEFERHGGCANFKKWKKSIIVVETGRNIGCWMVEHGLMQRVSRSKAAKAAAAAAKAAGTDAAAAGTIATGAWQIGGSSGADGLMAATDALLLHPQHQGLTAAGPWETQAAGAAAGAADPPTLMPVGHLAGQQQQQQQQQQFQGIRAGADAAAAGAMSCQRPPQGFELVGRIIRVWWPLDAAWYEGAVEGYQPEQDLHTIRYLSDGELEQLSLSQEQWQWQQPQPPLPHVMPHAAAAGGFMQQVTNQAEQQQHVALPLLKVGLPAGSDGLATAAAGSPRTAVNSSAAAACSPDGQENDISLWCDDSDGFDDSGEGNDDAVAAVAAAPVDGGAAAEAAGVAAAWQAEQQAWLAAAQRSVIDRPLRVVWDSAAGSLRVLLAAEFQMRRHLKWRQMEQLQLAQQQRQQEASLQQQQQAGQKPPREESASCENCSKSPGECAPWAAAAAAPGASSPMSGASTAGSSQATAAAASAVAAAAAAALYDGEGFKVPASKPVPQQPPALPAFTAAIGRGSESSTAASDWQQPTGWSVQQQQQWQPFQQPQPQLQQQQLLRPLAALPSSVPVVCGERRGSFMLSTRDVICHCHECDREHQLSGVYSRWAPAEFERHGGLAASRKWKNTLRVELQDGGFMGIGRWLERAGLDPPASKPQRPPARPKPAAAAAAAGAGWPAASAAAGLKRPLAVQPQQVQQAQQPLPTAMMLEVPAAKRQALGLPLLGDSSSNQQQHQQQAGSGSSVDWTPAQLPLHQQEGPLHQVLRRDDGFEVLLLLPEALSLPDISMRAWDCGRLLLSATTSGAAGSSGGPAPDGQPGFSRLIQLPGRIVSASASALLAPSGRELYVRVQECQRPVMTAAVAAADAAAAAAAAAGYASVGAGRF